MILYLTLTYLSYVYAMPPTRALSLQGLASLGLIIVTQVSNALSFSPTLLN